MATQQYGRQEGGEPKGEQVAKAKREAARRRKIAILEETRRRHVPSTPGPVDTAQSPNNAVALHKDFLNVVSASPAGGVEVQFTRDTDRGLRGYVAGGTEVASYVFDDFISAGPSIGVNGWQHNTSGTGTAVLASAVGVDATEKCQGVWSMSTGTDAGTGRAGIQMTQAGILFGQGTAFEFEARVAFDALSDTTNEYRAHVGLFDTVGSAALPVDAACFMYRRTTEGNFWVCVTSNNSNQDPTSPTNTTLTTVTAIVATVFQVLKVSVNSTGTSVEFRIDGTLVATHSANIPTGAGRQTGIGLRIYRTASAGTTPRLLYADFAGVRMSGAAR